MKRVLTAVLVASSLAVAGQASAQAPAPAAVDPTIHRHKGFYLQLDLGLGGLATSAESGGIKLEMSGGAGQFSVGIGGAVVENFILAGHIWGAVVNEPSVKLNGTTISGAGKDATLNLTGIGLNLTYYFMPINLYLSLTPSITMLSVEQGGTTSETENGFGIRFAVGKEWWVSDHWGIGLNGQLAFASNKDKPPGDATFGTMWFGVAFSATYN